MLSIEEQQELVRIIMNLYDFTDGGPRGKRLLLEQAGLHSFVSDIDLSGPSRVVAQDIVGRLERKGYLVPRRPTFHALGALLSYILTLSDLQSDEARFIARLIVRHSLILDPGYVDKLRSQYGILDVPIQPTVSTPVLTPPPPTTFLRTEMPTFNITLPDEEGLERVIDSEHNFLDIYLLAGAIYSAQAVCQIENRAGGGVKEKAIGTGFLIGPDLLLTNQHVVEDQRYLTEVVARFGYQVDASGVPQPGRIFDFKPDFYYSSGPSSLDYALLCLQKQPLKHMVPKDAIEGLSYLDLVLQGKHRGYLVLAARYMKEKERVNIIQHPDGQPMKVVLTRNYIAANMADTRVQYVADTMDGSSGSPVFNQNWEVVALHHSGKPYPSDSAKDVLKKASKGYFRVNEGIPVRAILKDFPEKGFGFEQYLRRP